MTGVQHIAVPADDAEQRLDRWIRKRWPHVGQGRIEKMCRRGQIRVDGGRAKAATRVAAGQVIRIPPLPAPQDADRAGQREQDGRSEVKPALIEELRDAVVFKDEHLIALNKPPGLPVQGGSKQKVHLGHLLQALRFERRDEPRLIHRLDRDTSGILILARTGAAATAMSQLFRSRAVRKTYIAAVAGRPDPLAGTITYGLQKAGDRGAERMEVVHPDRVKESAGAKPATTQYKVLEHLGNRMSAVVLRPITGRTHQLRAHMAALGTPIAGDGKYGGRGQQNLGDGWGAGLGGALSRKLHLHAAALSFRNPMNGLEMDLSAPLPVHMQRTWDTVGWSSAILSGDPFEEF
ncbi:MAG: RluA family pseudouridine synthase [Pseudomonadota bacterium]